MSSQEVTNVSLANTNKLYFVYYECYLPKKKILDTLSAFPLIFIFKDVIPLFLLHCFFS